MAKYSDSELLAAIEVEEGNSYNNGLGGKLQDDRDEALDYYLGEPFGNEIEDRSQVVTRDVADTIEWVLPSLLKVFMSGDEVVRFDPRGKEDIESAEQESEYVNYVVTQKNPGFQVFYTWFKDALLQKSGYVKVYWEEKNDYQDERYEGINEDELAFILADREVEIVEQSSMQDVFGQTLYSVKLRQTVPCKQVRIINIPPEELLVATRTKTVNLAESPFVEHRTYMTVSELRDMGYELDMSKMSSHVMPFDDFERNMYDENSDWENSETEEANRLVAVRDCYIHMDEDNDGIAELRRVLIAGVQVLENEEADFIPFAAICPIPMPHRHIGLSYADIVMDLQLLKSTILRNQIDNMYLSNNVRTAIDPSRVNLDDFLVSRPGGVVRTTGSPGESIMPLVNPPIASQSYSMLEYVDSLRENRTGVTKYNQGLDANSLNKTATGINAIMGAAQQRIELVARLFAETGVKELFLMVHALIMKYSDNVEMVKMRNDYVPIDPRQWKKRTDMTISVGLGTGNKDQMLQHLMMILQAQEKAAMSGMGLVTPKNIHYALSKMTTNAGFKDADNFWTDPELQPPQQQQLPPEVQKQMHDGMQMIQKLQAENQQLKADALRKDTDMQAKTYEVNKRSETELMKVQMQNESKEALAQFNAIADAIMQSQSEMNSKIQDMEATEPDFTPIMETIQALQAQIEGMQPVGIKQVRDENGRLIGGVRVLADGTEQEVSIQ